MLLVGPAVPGGQLGRAIVFRTTLIKQAHATKVWTTRIGRGGEKVGMGNEAFGQRRPPAI